MPSSIALPTGRANKLDRLLKRFDSVSDGDLALNEKRGFAYQRPMRTIPYDEAYQKKVAAYEDTDIAKKVNAGRVAFVKRHAKSKEPNLLDWGAGSGSFARAAAAAGFDVKTYDANPFAQLQLGNDVGDKPNPYNFEILTLWDTIEHLEQPELVIKNVRKGGLLFVSLPIFIDLKKIRESKHYRPNEHLYYWTDEGFKSYMALYGFRCIETSTHEVDAGRDSIGAYAFVRDLPDYNDHIAAYQVIHGSKHYGASATEEYLDVAAAVVRDRKPSSILDFGCGRSDLVAHFWLDGKRRIARYDPAIGPVKVMPEGVFDLIFCCDVLEHIPMADVDNIFAEIKQKGNVVLFTISTILARAKLPDGRNAHVTILSKQEWERWVRDTFGSLRVLKGKHEHELVVLTGVP